MSMKVPKRAKGKHTPSHERSAAQEKSIARRIRGRVTRGSGSGNEKGDVRLHRVCRIEAKTTKHKSFSVTRDMVNTLETIAMGHGELPAIVIEFNDDGKPVGEVAVVPTWVLDILAEHADTED